MCIYLLSAAHGFQSSSQMCNRATQSRANCSFRLKGNIYDDWAQDLLSTTQSTYTYDDLQLPYCDEEAIEQCLEEFMDSDYGKTMFGRHDLPASIG